ncbi:MAG: glutamine synthetase family protein [Bradymonadia bacterium]
MSPEQIIDRIRGASSPRVKLAVVDIDGVLRGKYVRTEKFLSAVDKGFGFCNVIFGWDAADVCYENSTYTGWHTGYPDAHARIDLSTFREVPWDDDVPFFLADFEQSDGSPLPICPRRLLRGVIDRAADMGYRAFFGPEFEWFNFRETPQSLADGNIHRPQPITPGMFGYSLLRAQENQAFFAAIMNELEAFGVPVEGLHTETGPGVFEAAISAAPALEVADRSVLFKAGVKDIARRFGIVPSFMAKWNAELPGCSGHLHQSLWDLEGKSNLFHQADAPHQMSPLFEHYLAGLMHCLPEILPVYAPTVNSFKRLVEGMWAPTTVTWGIENRTTALRVIPGGQKSHRVELRVPGSDINPYLAIAGALASGLYGIEHKLTLQSAPVTGNGYTVEGAPKLPGSLPEATERMAASPVARAVLGDAFVDHFAETRRWEWRQFAQAVTSWELERYFEII